MSRRVDTVFRIENGMRMPARKPVSGPGNAFMPRGTAFRAASIRTQGTIIVIRIDGQDEPWIALDRPRSGGVRGVLALAPVPVETGFKALKSVGWQWRKTQRTVPSRVERRCPVLMSATLQTLAYCSRVEDAQARKKNPGALRSPPKAAPERSRITGVFRLGVAILSRLPAKGRAVAARPASARTVDSAAGWGEGRFASRNLKPAPISPLWG